MAFDYSLVDEVIRKIVEKFSPRLIVVFGSVARGEARDGSDLDPFIVMDTPLSYYRRAPEVRRSLLKVPLPMDILVVTPEEYECHKDDRMSFMTEILRTGKIVYEA